MIDLVLKQLPDQVKEICQAVGAPPRLVAHLTLVHDVAAKLLTEIQLAYPTLMFNEEAVLFGAATHDIGKAMHHAELSGAGNYHEQDGERLLVAKGVAAELARFTRTHAGWRDNEIVTLEDLLVSLADTCWKGKREAELEERIARIVGAESGQEIWEVFLVLDDIVSKLAQSADERLAWQAQFSV